MVLITLLASNVYAEPKPYKVCPEVVTAKDTPCKVATPTASIVQRDIIKDDPRDKEIRDLKEENLLLRKLLDSQLGKTQESKQP